MSIFSSYFEISVTKFVRRTILSHNFFFFFQGLERITKILIDNGANVHIRDNDGNTPLEIAAVNGNFQA